MTVAVTALGGDLAAGPVDPRGMSTATTGAVASAGGGDRLGHRAHRGAARPGAEQAVQHQVGPGEEPAAQLGGERPDRPPALRTRATQRRPWSSRASGSPVTSASAAAPRRASRARASRASPPLWPLPARATTTARPPGPAPRRPRRRPRPQPAPSAPRPGSRRPGRPRRPPAHRDGGNWFHRGTPAGSPDPSGASRPGGPGPVRRAPGPPGALAVQAAADPWRQAGRRG